MEKVTQLLSSKVKRPKKVMLALQGGGAFGAFTWGVIDRLLDDPNIEIDSVSGVSAGAINGTALVSGLHSGGKQGAKDTLEKLWNRVAIKLPISNWQKSWLSSLSEKRRFALSSGARVMLGSTKHLSPYQLNPLDVNPLLDILNKEIDFDALNQTKGTKLFVGATHALSGKLRLFSNGNLTPEAIMASCCLPAMHKSVMIDNEPYWDGGFSANPAISPLIHEGGAKDLIVIMLQPIFRPHFPKSAKEISHRMAELGFNSHYLREMGEIAALKERFASRHQLILGKYEKRIRGLNIHHIEADDFINSLSADARFNNNDYFLSRLFEEGRSRAEEFLVQHNHTLGKRSSVDLSLYG